MNLVTQIAPGDLCYSSVWDGLTVAQTYIILFYEKERGAFAC